jgi:chloramphenicol-sensitive protein RarD
VTSASREGVLWAIGAYVLWGLVPFYFKPLMHLVRPEEVLAHRIVWSLAFIVPVLAATGRWQAARDCLRRPKVLALLVASAVLIAINWYIYVICVARNVIVQASLGYFLTPLVNVLLGCVFLGERLRRWQAAACVLAAGGVVNLIVAGGEFPWFGLAIAFSFGFYGLVRNRAPVDGYVGFAIETLALTPLALGYLVIWGLHGQLDFGSQSRGLDLLIACCGPVTALPLVCFGQAARRLPLTTLGFFQYLSPSLQFIIAVTVFGEELRPARIASFLLIWAAVGLFLWDSWRTYRTRPAAAPMVEG